MAASANVQSIEALKDFRTALCRFMEAARVSLGEADADLQRYSGWLSEDRQRHWKSEVSRHSEQAQRAKLVLLQKKLEKTSTGAHPSCVDEEKALALALRLLAEAQQKAENTKKWVRRLEELVFQYKGLLQALDHALDNEAVVAVAHLDGMTESLDKYVALAPPPGVEPELAASEAESMARPLNEPPDLSQESKQQPETGRQLPLEGQQVIAPPNHQLSAEHHS